MTGADRRRPIVVGVDPGVGPVVVGETGRDDRFGLLADGFPVHGRSSRHCPLISRVTEPGSGQISGRLWAGPFTPGAVRS